MKSQRRKFTPAGGSGRGDEVVGLGRWVRALGALDLTDGWGEGWVRSSKFKEDRETGMIKLNMLTMT